MRFLLAAYALVLATLLLGCERDGGPALIQVLEFTPQEAEVGDRLEVTGAGFPLGKTAHLAFRGTLHRPGEAPERGVEILAEGVVESPQRVEVSFTDALQAKFAGAGERALHTTFHGELEVAFSAASAGAPPIAGTLHKLTLDVRPPFARPGVAEARDAEGERALAFAGIRAGDPAPNGGLVVVGVERGSRADRAGLAAGDVLLRIDGVNLGARADAVPAPGARDVTLTFRRGESREERTRTMAMDGFRPAAPRELQGAAIVTSVATLVVLLFFAPTAGLFTWLERRVAWRLRRREGANGAAPGGPRRLVLAVRALFETDRALGAAARAPYVLFAAVSVVFGVLPFSQYLVSADFDVGILFVLATTAMILIALLTGGWVAGPRFSPVDGVRAVGQVLTGQAPAAIAVACVVGMTGSLRIVEIIRAQGGLPWEWYAFRSPASLGLFVLYFTAVLADGRSSSLEGAFLERPGAPVSGPRTGREQFFFFAEWAHLFVMAGVAAALFLGGWQLPGVTPGMEERSLLLQAAGSLLFLLKAWALILAVIGARWTLPRVQMPQLTRLCWRYFLPAAVVLAVITTLWVVWSPARDAQRLVGMATFACFVLACVYFAQRVRWAMRAPNTQLQLNPFL